MLVKQRQGRVTMTKALTKAGRARTKVHKIGQLLYDRLRQGQQGRQQPQEEARRAAVEAWLQGAQVGYASGPHHIHVPEDPDSDIEDRDEALQPDLTEAQQNRKASGEARAARDRDNTYHGRKVKLAHLIDHLPQALWDAFLDKAVQPRVEAISERGVLASLLFGLLVRCLFTIRVADPLGLHDQPVYTDIPVSHSWLRPVYSEAKRSQVRGLMSSTSYNIRFYDRDVSAALNIRRCAVGPGPRPTELCYWDGRPAMPKPGRPDQEWVYLRDKALLRKWRRKWRQ
ncbi:hypothetical protein QJQ45_009231 [Haematococcus lacustris]|nr:hypothetical protein QJQ45_009231 [Haematococcus lacustris]